MFAPKDNIADWCTPKSSNNRLSNDSFGFSLSNRRARVLTTEKALPEMVKSPHRCPIGKCLASVKVLSRGHVDSAWARGILNAERELAEPNDVRYSRYVSLPPVAALTLPALGEGSGSRS
jgi:hypothetical protein